MQQQKRETYTYTYTLHTHTMVIDFSTTMKKQNYVHLRTHFFFTSLTKMSVHSLLDIGQILPLAAVRIFSQLPKTSFESVTERQHNPTIIGVLQMDLRGF